MQLCLSAFGAAGDGITNDASALRACFTAAASGNAAFVTVEPGIYLVDSAESIPLSSHLTVRAYGATFLFPRELGNATNRRMFYGEDLTDVDWQGGHFVGYVYDPEREENPYQERPHPCEPLQPVLVLRNLPERESHSLQNR